MSPDILKLLAILLKHSGEIPNVIAKGQAAVAALTTKGIEHIDPVCDFLNALKPAEQDLIAGGFLATHIDEATLKAEFGKLGDGTLLAQLLVLLNSPAMATLLPLILKLLGL